MDWNYFKENVSIVQLVEALGYSFNKQKGKEPKQYEHPNGDKVIISQKLNPNMEVYFTRNNYDDNGTVVDFVKNRLSMFNVYYDSEWEGVIKVLPEFAGKPFEPVKKEAVNSGSRDKFNKEEFEIRSAKMEDLTYLQYDRKLRPETIKAFISNIRMVRQNGKPFNNIGFPYTIPEKYSNDPEINGFELVNYMFKGHAKGSNRKEAVWLANLSESPQLIRDIFIAESAIDAMSYYELNHHKYNFEHAVFISTGGNVLKDQVKNILKAFPDSKCHTIFDNDFSGKMYDILFACVKSKREIVMRKKNESVVFELKKGIFEIPANQISLFKFERLTGIRSGVRTHKATGKDFNEMLQNLKNGMYSRGGVKRI